MGPPPPANASPAGTPPVGKPGFRRKFSVWLAAVRTHYLVLLVFTLVVYFPRLGLSYLVFGIAQLLRMLARVVGTAKGRQVQNRRILIITDYLPPQTHGIAIRCHAYAKELRAQGHEVVVFATAYEASKETSFDHPNIPSVVNPFNLGNRIGYSPGVKLSWFLGAYTWDVVHLVFPSLIGFFVLSACTWRCIPVYCSHHVELEVFADEHVRFRMISDFGKLMYTIFGKWPAKHWGTLNAAPTLCFARQHLAGLEDQVLRRVPSGTHDVFRPEPSSSDERAEIRRQRFGVEDDDTKVAVMVQRLSAEKGTHRVFPAFVPKKDGGEGVGGVLAIAGDGPSKDLLMEQAKELGIKVVFLGRVPHSDLPQIYRAADCFVTMSLSETFGLTSLEALMCGCPAVMPYCEVFNEIWGEGGVLCLPKAWRYDIDSLPQLAAAIASSQQEGREWLRHNPINQTWRKAAEGLLEQYEECIKLTEEERRKHRELVTMVSKTLRAVICALCLIFVLGLQYKVTRFISRVLGIIGVRSNDEL